MPLQIYRVATLEEAVVKAREVAKQEEVVLFSPASSSHDMFEDFEKRGDCFRQLVMALEN